MDRLKVKRLREALGHTQEEFAAAFPVSTKTVSRWELGEVSPSPLARRRMQEIAKSRKSSGERESESSTDHNASTEDDDTAMSVASSTAMPRRRGVLPSSM